MQDMRLSVFILGTTAVGKTKLSLQLCKHLKGQIVSCDSKQLYRHANLMTAKPTPEELKAQIHHMVDCLQLDQASYNRNKFYEQVKIHTRRIWDQGKTPIFIGGTNYYLDPILFNVQNLGKIQSDCKQQLNQPVKGQQHQKLKDMIEKQENLAWIKTLTKQQKYQELKQVDPVMAQKLHKNDETRVNSFLQKFYKYNKKPSQSYKPYSNQLNNQNTILFWVRNSDKLQHKVVVQQRIKEMLDKQGILQILSVFAYLDIHYSSGQLQKDRKPLNQQAEFQERLRKRLTVAGIGQSIGYKEFYQFYFHFRSKLLYQNCEQQKFKQISQLYNNKDADYKKIHSIFSQKYEIIQKQLLNTKMLQEAQQQLIRDTWAYCKRQITWIRNRIFLKDTILLKRFYILDLAKRQRKNSISGDEDGDLQQTKKHFDKKDLLRRFQVKVKEQALNIVQQIQKRGFQSAYQKLQRHQDEFKEGKQEIKLEDWKKYTCKQCQVQLNGPNQWQEHVRSKRHSKRVKYLQRKGDIDKWIQLRMKKEAQNMQTDKNNC